MYPNDWEPEPYSASWSFLLKHTLRHLDGDVSFLSKALAQHVGNEPAYASDRELCQKLLTHLEESGERQPFERLLFAMLDGTGFDADSKNRLKMRRYGFLLGYGWKLLKARELEGARAVANEMLEFREHDGQALFFDARLHWLETDDPAQGIERAKAHLAGRGAKDRAGRGQLLNLVGCGYDALGEAVEALPYLQKATQTHGAEPMYFANVAECHYKLGNTDEARHFAQEALSRGAQSDLREEILKLESGDRAARKI